MAELFTSHGGRMVDFLSGYRFWILEANLREQFYDAKSVSVSDERIGAFVAAVHDVVELAFAGCILGRGTRPGAARVFRHAQTPIRLQFLTRA